jgi:hypothetical protein
VVLNVLYLDGGSKLPLGPATKLVVQRVDGILHGVEGLNALPNQQGTAKRTPPQMPREDDSMASHGYNESVVIDPSRGYLQTLVCRTTADTVLTWPIWRDKVRC